MEPEVAQIQGGALEKSSKTETNDQEQSDSQPMAPASQQPITNFFEIRSHDWKKPKEDSPETDIQTTNVERDSSNNKISRWEIFLSILCKDPTIHKWMNVKMKPSK